MPKTKSVCPPGLRTPSAGNVLRRLEAEGLCERLTTQNGVLRSKMESLQESASALRITYEQNVGAETPSTHNSRTLQEQLDEVQRKVDDGLRINDSKVYEDAVERSKELVIDVHQMERKEVSSRNDLNKILNLIEQHEQNCKGASIIGRHTMYPDFLPKKDATLRGGK
jgi:gas vesicle protein